jgi:MEMO1 family protein
MRGMLRTSFRLCYTIAMQNPKIRYIDAIPISKDGAEMVVIRDVEGVSESQLMVSRDMIFLISWMDGTRTLLDLQAEYTRTFGQIIYMEHIESLVEALDSNLFLQSERFTEHYARLRREYEEAPVRTSCLAGKSYPEHTGDLLLFLADMFEGAVERTHEKEITGILAPHIDYARGKAVYPDTYASLKGLNKPLIVLLGTCHLPTEKILSISLKDFSTPLGIIPNCRGLCDLIKENGVLRQYLDEWPHRSEHSIELQLPLIQFMTSEYDVEVLPILTGSMHEFVEGRRVIEGDEEVEAIVGALKQVLQSYGRPYVVVSGADLAHIGAQFGDQYALDPATMDRSKQKDLKILDRIKDVDAKGFFEAIKDEGDERRICGLTPIYFQLRLLEGSAGDIVSYDQWTDGASSVSFAGGIFYKTG